jgi:hypothetical protein
MESVEFDMARRSADTGAQRSRQALGQAAFEAIGRGWPGPGEGKQKSWLEVQRRRRGPPDIILT